MIDPLIVQLFQLNDLMFRWYCWEIVLIAIGTYMLYLGVRHCRCSGQMMEAAPNFPVLWRTDLVVGVFFLVLSSAFAILLGAVIGARQMHAMAKDVETRCNELRDMLKQHRTEAQRDFGANRTGRQSP